MPNETDDVKYWTYPFVSFSFKVVVMLDGRSEIDCNFQEVSGLSVTVDTEEVKEGGENRFSHRIPGRPKFQNLVLKRGMFKSEDSRLLQWAQKALLSFTFKPVLVLVKLLDEKQLPVATWNVYNAYPVAIKAADFKSTDNNVAIETLELAFDYFERKN